MNIFVLDKDPGLAVQMLCDCHVRKMCMETAQILSGVMLRNGFKLIDRMPKPQNVNHPVISAIDAPEKIIWVCVYYYYLLKEYAYRFNKLHKYTGVFLEYYPIFTPGVMPDCTGLAKYCGDLDVSQLDIVSAYRMYYTEVKKPQLIAKNLWKFTQREDWTK
jgi:hypothetical protein